MTLRVCLDCMATIKAGRSRCTSCERLRDKARGSREERGYGREHKALRADYQHRMDAGETFTCWRCPRRIDPGAWTLGHCDDDRNRYHGPECPPCDYATAGRTRCPHPEHQTGAGISPDA